MASRSADATLVKGAATAYKNYDNDPAVYAGLDKLVKAGIKHTEDAIALKRKRNDKINEDADKAFKDVLKQEGNLQTNVDKALTRQLMDGLREEYIVAKQDGNKEEIDRINGLINQESAYLKDYMDFRLDVAGGKVEGEGEDAVYSGLSSAMDGTDHKDILQHIAKEGHSQEFVERQDADGNITKVRVFTGVTDNGTEYSMTLDELKDITIFDQTKLVTAYNDYIVETAGTTFLEGDAKNTINKMIPTKPNDMRGFLAGELVNGNSLRDMLKIDNTRDEIDKILFDTNDTPGIQDDEFEVYLNAVTNPYTVDLNGNEIWGGDLDTWMEFTRPIVQEKLYYGLVNRDNELRTHKLAERHDKDLYATDKEAAIKKYKESVAAEQTEEEGEEGTLN